MIYNYFAGSDTERRYRSSDQGDSDIDKRYPKGDYKVKPKHYRESEEERKRYPEKEPRKERLGRETKEERRYTGSSDRESDLRTSDVEQNKSRETTRKSRSMTADSLESPALVSTFSLSF